MEIICKSSLDEYARHFWQRQRAKEDPKDKDAVTDIDKGGDPRWWLWKKYDFKLPRPDNDIVTIALLDQGEVEALLIHKYMVDDEWMQASNIVPEPKTRVLRDLTKIAISRGYFSSGCWNNTHHDFYHKWKKKGSLENAIKGDKPLVESVGPNEYEIVDGWGRLLPFVALLQEGYHFHPIECFVACRGYHALQRAKPPGLFV